MFQPAPVSTSQSICCMAESVDCKIQSGQMCSPVLGTCRLATGIVFRVWHGMISVLDWKYGVMYSCLHYVQSQNSMSSSFESRTVSSAACICLTDFPFDLQTLA